MSTLPSPLRGDEERWNDQRTVPVDPSGSHQPPLFPQHPIGHRQAQAGNSQRPPAPPPVFAQNQFLEAYGIPQNPFPGVRFRANEHPYRVPPPFPPSSNSTEGLRSYLHNMSDLNSDGRHRHSMPPLRRPPHWEDDPYAPSSFRDSDIARDRGAFPGPYGHCYQPGPHHYHRPPACGTVPASFDSGGHCPPHHPGFWPCDGHPHHCTYKHNCCSPGADWENRRSSTLTYIGPPICGGHVHRSHCLHSCEPVAPVPASQRQMPPDTADTTLDERSSREQPSANTKNGWGDVGRWLGKRFSAAKRVIPKILKRSNTRLNEAESCPQEPQSRVTATLSAESNSETAPTAATTSRTGENPNSNSSETTGVNPSSSDDTPPSSLPRDTDEPIPRPVSSASTCQCDPSAITLHRVLQHKPFDSFELQWNITLPPKGFVFWGSTPEEILAGRPVHFPDDALFLETATDPPIRHMFINAMGDFPLERCQGDPDPSRSKDKERHMYNSGLGDQKIELRTLPWPIRITGTSTPGGYITLWDVFRTIHLNFQQYMRKEEYELYIIERKRLIASAYHQRKRVLDGKRNYRPIYGHIPETEIMENYIEDGYMRCDYLGSSLIFRGLEAGPDGAGYTLFLGPH